MSHKLWKLLCQDGVHLTASRYYFVWRIRGSAVLFRPLGRRNSQGKRGGGGRRPIFVKGGARGDSLRGSRRGE